MSRATTCGYLRILAAIVGSCSCVTARSDDSSRSFEIYGFAQVDYIQDSKRLDSDWEDAFRPSKIAVPEGQFGVNGAADLSAKQSRIGVEGSMPTTAGASPIKFKFEIDMFGVGGNAGETAPRLRHAYGEWGALLGGQTHTVFMDIDVYPNTIDYWGPIGMVFVRNPQVRLTPWRSSDGEAAFAIERPSNDVDPGNIRLFEGFTGAVVRGHEAVPDFTAHYRLGGAWGHLQLAGLLRRVGYEYQSAPDQAFNKGSRTGWGANLSGALKLAGRDRLLLQVDHGDGIATYMNDGGMDLAPKNRIGAAVSSPSPTGVSLQAEAVPLTGVMAYLDHYWTRRWSSSLGYSFVTVDNTNFQTGDAFHRGDYASINLLMYPADQLVVGAELLWGERTNHDGRSGHDARFQFSAKYSFEAVL